MRFQDLSPADQKLLNTDLGDFEKEAAAELALADEMYAVGFEKLAAETADYLEELYASEKTASEGNESMDDESEKRAHDLAAFIERGYFDGLRKLGSERYNDEMAYLYPFIEEKIAAEGARAALGKAYQVAKGHVKTVGKAAKNVAHELSPKSMATNLRQAATGTPHSYTKGSPHSEYFAKQMLAPLSGKERAMEGVRGGAKALGYLGLGGAAYKGLKGKKKEEQ